MPSGPSILGDDLMELPAKFDAFAQEQGRPHRTRMFDEPSFEEHRSNAYRDMSMHGLTA